MNRWHVVFFLVLLAFPLPLEHLDGIPGEETRGSEARDAAEWILSRGGRLVVQVEDEALPVAALRDLPTGTIEITEIDLAGKGITDDDLARLGAVRTLKRLDLSRNKISDRGLAHLAGLSGLRYLYLRGTRIMGTGLVHLAAADLRALTLSGTRSFGDAGLVHFANHQRLRFVGLAGTAVTDQGLEHLVRLENLRSLRVDRTAVTDDGLAVILRAHPDCDIVRDVSGGPKVRPASSGVGEDEGAGRAAYLSKLSRQDGWIFELQLALLLDALRARSSVEDFAERGYRPYIVEVKSSKGETRYTVRIGPYRTMGEAAAMAAKMREEEGLATVIRFRSAPR